MLPPPPQPCPEPVGLFMYDDVNYSGDLLTLQPGREMPDLTQQHSWPFGREWNDRISSFVAGCCVGIVHEHINFQGSVMFSGGTPKTSANGVGMIEYHRCGVSGVWMSGCGI